MSTHTSPGPGSGSGNSWTTTASGGPCSRTYAARTPLPALGDGVVARLGEVGRTLHELEHDRPERLELLVVSPALVSLLEHHRELPLGEDDVVVDVVDLTARDRRVV